MWVRSYLKACFAWVELVFYYSRWSVKVLCFAEVCYSEVLRELLDLDQVSFYVYTQMTLKEAFEVEGS